MKLAIVIVHYNSSGDLARCLESLTTYPPGCEHAIVVVDNASEDDGLGDVQERYPHVHWLLNSENLGYARGANRGIAAVRAEYYLILNPDIVAQPGAVDSLLAFADEHVKAGIVGPQLLNENGSIQDSCRRFYTFKTLLLRRTILGKIFPHSRTVDEHLMRDFDHNSSRPVDWVLGGCLLARHSAMERTGPMDERFFLYFEDVDWCYRMWQAGCEVLYTPDARFTHRHRRESAKGALHKSFWLHLGSLISFYEKWGMMVYLLKRWREPLVVFLLWAVDMVALWSAFLAAYGLRSLANPMFPEPLYSLSEYRSLLLFGSLLATVTFLLAGRYRRERRRQASTPLARLQQVGTVSVLLLASTYLGKQEVISRAVLLLFIPLFALTTALGEDLFRSLRRRLEFGYFSLERTLLVGAPAALQSWLEKVRDLRLLGIDPVGYVAEPTSPESPALPPLSGGEVPWLGRWADLLSAVQKWRISQIVFWVQPRHNALDAGTLAKLRRMRIRLRWRIDETWLLAAGARAEQFGGEVSALLEPGTGSALGSLLTRLMGLGVALLLAIIAAPFYLWLRLVAQRRGTAVVYPVSCDSGWGIVDQLRIVCSREGRVLPLWWQWFFVPALWQGRLHVWGARLQLAARRDASPSPLETAEFWRHGHDRPGLTGPWAGETRAKNAAADMVPTGGPTDLTFSFAATWIMICYTVRSLLLDPGGLGRVPPPEVSFSPEQREANSPREVP